MKQFYSVSEVAEITGLSKETIRNYIQDGKIYASRPGESNRSPFLIPHSEILRLKGENGDTESRENRENGS
jgi:excisionase family DNA binding protein